MKRSFPPQIKYIVGNEACERFSFYGMRSILVIFMVQHLMMPEPDAKAVFHLFVSGGYLATLLGGYLADRFLGKYRTIMLLSLIYCMGHGVLALGDGRLGLYGGLALIALGMGGVKSCVSAYVGDQFSEENKSLVDKVFALFYWAINCGSFFSTLLIPWILPRFGPRWAFGLPGILMGFATVIFWLGRDLYVNIPPVSQTGEAGFMPILLYALRHRNGRKAGEGLMDVALARYSREEVEAAKAAARIFKVFIAVSMFWALYDQYSSSWVLQATRMRLDFMGFHLEPSQLAALNPILILTLIPVFSLLIYPAIERRGVAVTPLRRISAGMIVAAFSFIAVGLLQVPLDHGRQVCVAWQFIPYLILATSEILVSITGLEFAYTQAPPSMKGTIMSFWFLTITAGNWLTAAISKLNVFSGAAYFFFFAALMALVSGAFILAAIRHQVHDYLEKA